MELLGYRYKSFGDLTIPRELLMTLFSNKIKKHEFIF